MLTVHAKGTILKYANRIPRWFAAFSVSLLKVWSMTRSSSSSTGDRVRHAEFQALP